MINSRRGKRIAGQEVGSFGLVYLDRFCLQWA